MSGRVRVKICCIASAEEARLAVAAGADALGFVGGAADDAAISAIVAEVPPPVATFLLTPHRRAADIVAQLRLTGANTVQIVDHLDPAEPEALARALPMVRRVQVIHVEGPEALALIPRYAPHVHAFLLDSGKPGGTMAELGGTGRVHDWQVSRAFVAASPRPVFLAGGLTPANAAEAIARVGPFGLDLCSGVRTGGRLDADKLAAFMAAVRSAA